MSAAAPGPGNPADPAAVRGMFDRIAPLYDAMNTLMTGGIDGIWRRAAVRAARLRPGMAVLDVACGTGRLAEAASARVGSEGRVVGVDISEGMLSRARARGAAVDFRLADALALPFPAASFDAALIGFGLRNVPDYAAALSEMRRVVRPGGRVVVLEIAEPRGGIGRRLFRTWFRRVVPLLGRLARQGAAYRYLPASMLAYPPPDAVAGLLRAAGLEEVRWRWLPVGLATLHVGRVPADP
ncbi:MAG TPA: ubiquinone/menaquinone biosynthesis methyltransferase [Candidatus Limnocylindria bacterium]|nr:ubiquinone/menaquinone biosynthesis methyltransferase [Candidatus Limnocylindria bacterium]